AGRGSFEHFSPQRYCGNVVTCEEGGHDKSWRLEVTPRRFLVGVLLFLVFAARPAVAQSASHSILMIDQSDVRGPFSYNIFSSFPSDNHARFKSPGTIQVESLEFY